MVKGYIPPKKKRTLADAIKTKIANEVDTEIESLDKKLGSSLEATVEKVDKKLEEVDLHIENSDTILNKKIEEVDKVIRETKDTLNETLDEVADYIKENAIQGEPGDDAEPVDQDKIIEEVLSRIPKVDQDALVKTIIAQIPASPVINEDKLLAKFLKRIPSKKGDLKIIQEKIETDPMSVIEEIMKLPKDKVKWKSSQVEGLDQTIRAFQSQLSRGYLHGGGMSKVTTDATLTGDGTPASPLGGISRCEVIAYAVAL